METETLVADGGRCRVHGPKQKTAYEMCVGDWSSDVCSSDLVCWKLISPVQGLRLGMPEK